ncbi:cytochrome b/b6 domain-containing protein [Halomonas sp. H33-56]|uniref:cytochrome b/b6 domain-containing protein n=1 Tax=Halomonas sp. H33-56 TaxID=2950873 RepID=UPI0032DF05AC
MASIPSHSKSRQIKVWDPLVRVFHWALVLGVALNYAEIGPHRYIGYTLMGLIGLRVVWGLVGPWSVRWSSFWPTPSRLGAALKRQAAAQEAKENSSPQRITHTPLGAVMMLLMLALLVGLGTTGILMVHTERFHDVHWMEELHEGLATAVLCLVPLHVGGAILEGRRLGDNLIAAMVHGRRRVRPRV